MNNVIVRPLITEKTMTEAEKGKFTFEVNKLAGKTAIRQALKAQFGVDVMTVFTTISKGRIKHVGKMRQKIKASSFKKAVVQLKNGQKIGLFELGS